MKSSFGRGANWRLTRLSSPFCLSVALLVIAVPSHAQDPCKPTDMNSKYHAAYDQIVANIPKGPTTTFWRQVTRLYFIPNDKDHPPITVPTGLGIWNTTGSQGPGIISEALSYAMILAALYDDQKTFDKLSATVQAGIAYNKSKGNPPLFPWYWTPFDPNNPNTTFYSPAKAPDNPNLGLDSASDADINIALAYIYADMAVTNCGWGSVSNPTLNYVNPSYAPAPSTYHEMASNYIKAIRCGDPDPMACAKQEVIGDFSKTDTDANNHVLADGYTQATAHFGQAPYRWHPDYSDIRAYQLFKTYDTAGAAFWDTAISTTKASWKAIFYFGSNDTRKTENANAGQINPSTSWVMLSNPTYQTLQANSDYSQVKADRNDLFNSGDVQLYTADSQRLPIRLLNYLNATKNSTDPDYMSMLGIASANFTALATSYTNKTCQSLADKVNIGSPWAQPNSGFIQNFNAAGLLAYASNNTLSYVGIPPDLKPRSAPTCPAPPMTPIKTDLAIKFGSNGTNGTINMDITCPAMPKPTDKCLDGFNALLSLWALTVSQDGQTPLQKYILSQ